MPRVLAVPLDWFAFISLPGARDTNWEALGRELVRRNYERYGRLVAFSQQAGVEYHLYVDEECELGSPGRHWGWQAKWYDLPASNRLGAARRRDIEDSLRMSERQLPDLTDWVLWLHKLPSAPDVTWFHALTSRFRLRLWTGDEVDGLASGSASTVRAAYFGELVRTPLDLEACRERSIAPVRQRWDPAVHVSVPAERALRRVLAEPGTWPELGTHAATLAERAGMLMDTGGADMSADAAIETLRSEMASAAVRLAETVVAINENRPANARSLVAEDLEQVLSTREIRTLARRLRAMRHPSALIVSASVWDLARASELVTELRRDISIQICAVIGDAGLGKTYLAAELTQPNPNRPAGIFVMGRNLAGSHGWDELARSVPGLALSSFDEVLEAIEAAGSRAGARIPVFIDGLNEAEYPASWTNLIESLLPALQGKQHVVILLTLRSSARRVIPRGTPVLKLPGFRHNVAEAVEKYFDYYLIEPGDTDLPWDRFESPLFLRIFCEATNPERTKPAGPEAVPKSLTAAFQLYREVAVGRVSTQLHLADSDVQAALDTVAMELWTRGSRWLPFGDLRCLVGDGPRAWQDSLARALEDEGVLSREREAEADQQSAILFDAFAGHLIADAIITRVGAAGFNAWVGSTDTRARLGAIRRPVGRRMGRAISLAGRFAPRAVARRLDTRLPEKHPLSDDIVDAFVGLLPRKLYRPFWPLLTGRLRREAVTRSADLEGALIDAETCKELESAYARADNWALIVRSHAARYSARHPLNAAFLGKVLERMAVNTRDLFWSEWIRANRDTVEADIVRFETSITDGTPSESVALHARWVAWTLTSTVRGLRDRATRALFHLGLAHPLTLFQVAESFLDVNDPYVRERVLGASYGAAMAHRNPTTEFTEAFAPLVGTLRGKYCEPDASNSTAHWLEREYVRGLLSLAELAGLTGVWRLALPAALPARLSEEEAAEVRATLHMDFENYTVGRLIPDRDNYDMDHPEYKQVLSVIHSRIWQLGWRKSLFGEIDKRIGNSRFNSEEEGRIDRYGKKYGWLGFYEIAGELVETGKLRLDEFSSERLSDIDIDPSFPQPPPRRELSIRPWASATPKDDKRWLTRAPIDIPTELLRTSAIDGHHGPWLAAEGYLRHRDPGTDRSVFGFIRCVLVDPADAGDVVTEGGSRTYLGNSWVPEVPGDYYVFAGEFPWLPSLAHHANLYEVEIESSGRAVSGEVLAHEYRWESYHSELNKAGQTPVPSVRFSRAFDLRWRPPSFDQVEPSGRVASMTRRGPAGFEGDILYLREDLVDSYAGGRRLVWMVWGERQLKLTFGGPRPKWYDNVVSNYKELWRDISVR